MIYRSYEPLGHPSCNPGDHIVERGARKLFGRLGIDIEASETLYVVGTPWLWHRCAESQKYADLRSSLKESGFKRKVALGIGSCFAWQGEADLGEGDALEIWKDFDVVICRDELAAGLVDGICLPCPSLWAVDSAPATRSGFLAVDCDPWHPEYRTEKWIPKNYDRLNYADGFQSQDQIDQLLQKLLSYRRVMSKRVHAAIPISPFTKTKIVPADSRALTAVRVGVTPDSWSSAARIMEQREGVWVQGYRDALY